MKINKLLTIIGSICILLGMQSCATMEAYSKGEAAEVEIAKAKAMGFEWRDSKKILKKGYKALDDGDMEKGAKLIATAKQQGINAQTQAKAEMNAGPR